MKISIKNLEITQGQESIVFLSDAEKLWLSSLGKFGTITLTVDIEQTSNSCGYPHSTQMSGLLYNGSGIGLFGGNTGGDEESRVVEIDLEDMTESDFAYLKSVDRVIFNKHYWSNGSANRMGCKAGVINSYSFENKSSALLVPEFLDFETFGTPVFSKDEVGFYLASNHWGDNSHGVRLKTDNVSIIKFRLNGRSDNQGVGDLTIDLRRSSGAIIPIVIITDAHAYDYNGLTFVVKGSTIFSSNAVHHIVDYDVEIDIREYGSDIVSIDFHGNMYSGYNHNRMHFSNLTMAYDGETVRSRERKNSATMISDVTYPGKYDIYSFARKEGLRRGCESCKELQRLGETMSGRYTIYPFWALSGVEVYCDMETAGGGWTLILGPGTKLGNGDALWQTGDAGAGEMFTFNGESFNTTLSAELLKHMPFKDLMMTDSTKYFSFSSATEGNFFDKKFESILWTKIEGDIPSLTWGLYENDGYTNSRHVLGGRDITYGSSYGDLKYHGIGITAAQNALTQNHSWSGKPSTGYVYGAYGHGVGYVGHRYSADNQHVGLFFR